MHLKNYALFLLILTSLLNARIIQTDSILSTLSYILDDHYKNHQKLIIFDLDETILAPNTQIGSTQWLDFIIEKKIRDEGLSEEQAKTCAHQLCDAILETLSLQTVEECTPTLISELQKANIPTIALTARPKKLQFSTEQQLSKVQIDFSQSKTLPMYSIELLHSNDIWYENGIIYTGHNNKGESLIAFFQAIEWQPQLIIFVDDRIKRVQEVDQYARKHKIKCNAFHYTYLKNRKKTKLDVGKIEDELQEFFEKKSKN